MASKRKFDQCDEDEMFGSPCKIIEHTSRVFDVGGFKMLGHKVDEYMSEIAASYTGDPDIPQLMEHQRFFVGAIVFLSDNDEGLVEFFLSGYDVRKRIDRNAQKVAIGILDADNLVLSIQSFLYPYGLEKPHEWSVNLFESTEHYLKRRIAYVHNISMFNAKRFLVSAVLIGIGIRHAPSGVWDKT